MMLKRFLLQLPLATLAIAIACLTIRTGRAQDRSAQKPPPTHADVSYGPHPQQRLDIWEAKSEAAAPLVIYIHGGGFRSGSKESINPRTLQSLLDAGMAVACFEYRLLQHARLPAAHEDCRQALQFVRQHADRWNIDKSRVGAFGGSAGAQICMWLAFHDEMAQPASDEPSERESTRLQCVATSGGQTTMDFAWWKANIPGYDEAHRQPSEYFGDIAETEREKIIRDISAFSLLSADDPPILMSYRMAPGDPVPSNANEVQGWKVHHVSFGVALKKLATELHVEAHLDFPGATTDFSSPEDFFLSKLARVAR